LHFFILSKKAIFVVLGQPVPEKIYRLNLHQSFMQPKARLGKTLLRPILYSFHFSFSWVGMLHSLKINVLLPDYSCSSLCLHLYREAFAFSFV
jgi:hypothetical protein